jgi:RNA polymerase-interacting CarD/CdnL/TRCF family regulator
MMMFTALLAEVSSMRDRLDTYEALAASGRPITTAEVDAFVVSEADQRLREARREALLKRVFRVLLEELEEAQLALSQNDLETVLTEDNTSLKDAVSADD